MSPISQNNLIDWQHQFAESRCLLLKSVLTEPLLSTVYRYGLARFNQTLANDDNGKQRIEFDNDPLALTLSELHQSMVESFSGLSTRVSDCAVRIYHGTISVDPTIESAPPLLHLVVTLGFETHTWPIYIGTGTGIHKFELDPGDALLTHNCPYWRGPLARGHFMELLLGYRQVQ